MHHHGFRSGVLAALLAVPACGASLFTAVTVDPGQYSPDAAVTHPGFAALTSTFGPSLFSGTGTAAADYGTLRLWAQVALVNYPAQSFMAPCSFNPAMICGSFPVNAEAGFIDTLTILGGSGTGYLSLGFDLEGTTSLTTNLSDAISQGALSVYRDTYAYGGTFIDGTGFTGSMSWTARPIAFTFGSPFTLAFLAEAFIDAGDYSPASGPYSLEGTADFAHTIQVGALNVYADPALQTQIHGISVAAESGTQYPVGSVPEPGTIPLAAIGLAVVLWVAKSRQAPAKWHLADRLRF